MRINFQIKTMNRPVGQIMDGRSSIPFMVNKNVHKIYTAYHLQYMIYGIMTWNDRFRRVWNKIFKKDVSESRPMTIGTCLVAFYIPVGPSSINLLWLRNENAVPLFFWECILYKRYIIYCFKNNRTVLKPEWT